MKTSETIKFSRLAVVPVITWVGLLVLLASTIALAYVPMGAFNLFASLGIAGAKIAIIAAIFMGWRTAATFQRLASGAGIFWLIILFMLIFADYLSR